MISRQRGHIVAIASVGSFIPLGRLVCYCASKFGVHGLMESFQDELCEDGLQDQIFTTSVYPFFMNTRKELISGLARINIVGRVPIFTPKLIARETVNGIRRNKKQVFVPDYMGFLLKRYVHLPSEVRKLGQTILFKTKLPRMME
ncbi:17-beta-hydroxysteroid dehydrogenase 13-like [Malaya genurostris]|uniref:17-beta-hydroxysteroid dehydrogenase 13-like n=1 Tax=Malaya genurostris TaxID=325434 RepID=UPI0026F3C837|nr:17-beta-hydroxysteroid dehydrogenase 13-like [Malaya genurostris]